MSISPCPIQFMFHSCPYVNSDSWHRCGLLGHDLSKFIRTVLRFMRMLSLLY